MPLPPKIRVLIVDQRQETRDNLAQLLFLAPDITVVGLAESAQDAILQCERTQPDLLLIDLTLPDLTAYTILAANAAQLRPVRSILMTRAGTAHLLPAPLPATVGALLVKPITAEALIAAIRHAR